MRPEDCFVPGAILLHQERWLTEGMQGAAMQ
jgi:hypothetical protein